MRAQTARAQRCTLRAQAHAQIRRRRNSSGETPSARARCTRRSSSSVESSTVSGCHASTGSPSTKSASSSASSSDAASSDAGVECGIGTRVDDRHGLVDSRRPSRSVDGGDGCAVARPAGTRGHRAAAAVGLGDGARPGVGRLVQLVPDVALHPLEPVPAARQHLVEALQQLDVHHRLAVGLAPALALPPGHPLGDRVDHVLAVAEHVQLVVEVRGRAEELEHGGQLGLVVGGVRPAARRPARVVDVPGPARGAGVSKSRSVGGGDDHGVPSSEVRPHRIGRPRHRAAHPSVPPVARRSSPCVRAERTAAAASGAPRRLVG